MRASYGKGIAYSRINGKGVVYISTPGFFLVALDAETGAPLKGFGGQVSVEGFPETGVVDMLANLGHPYDLYEGIPLETGKGEWQYDPFAFFMARKSRQK